MNKPDLTLCKLIVLTMLDKVSFPLTKAQVLDFVLGKDYADYINFQQAFTEMADNGLIDSNTRYNRTYIHITNEGREAISFFEGNLDEEIRNEIRTYCLEEGWRLRNETSVVSDYYKSVSGDYEVVLVSKERDTVLVEIKLSVPTKEIASSLCSSWYNKNQEVYRSLVDILFEA